MIYFLSPVYSKDRTASFFCQFTFVPLFLALSKPFFVMVSTACTQILTLEQKTALHDAGQSHRFSTILSVRLFFVSDAVSTKAQEYQLPALLPLPTS